MRQPIQHTAQQVWHCVKGSVNWDREFVCVLLWDPFQEAREASHHHSVAPLSIYTAICRSSLVASTSAWLSASQLWFIHENDSWLYFIQTHAAHMESGTLPITACIHKSCSEYVSICFYSRTIHCLYNPQFSVASSPGVPHHTLAVTQIFVALLILMCLICKSIYLLFYYFF